MNDAETGEVYFLEDTEFIPSFAHTKFFLVFLWEDGAKDIFELISLSHFQTQVSVIAKILGLCRSKSCYVAERWTEKHPSKGSTIAGTSSSKKRTNPPPQNTNWNLC